jgi:hypothetical protein
MAPGGATPRVVVVCENPETVDGLQTYFFGVGIPAESARSLEATRSLPKQTTALVVFPDGFRATEVIERVLALQVKWPRLLQLLITSEPRRFSAALQREGSSASLLVLPRPVFGWTIVDAIRLHAEGQSS